MTRDELAALKAAAEKATRPWVAQIHGGFNGGSVAGVAEHDGEDGGYSLARTDRDLIALCNPAAILRLVAHVERMEAQIEEARASLNGSGGFLDLLGDIGVGLPVTASRMRGAVQRVLDVLATKEPDRG